MRELRPAAPPRVGAALAEGAGARERAVAAALTDALIFLGLEPGAGREVVVGVKEPEPEAVWLQPAALTGPVPDAVGLSSRGFLPADLDFYLRATHYRRPLAFSWDGLAAARSERARLAAVAREHAVVSQEPSARALAGYLHRFSEALRRDLDLPGAAACVRDGLRPGALSPGSRAALLRRTLPVLRIDNPGGPC